jgi:CBS domain containing-hemolysin-like protein
MLTVLVAIVIIALLVGLNGLYVAAEFSTVGARHTRLRQLANGGNRMAQMMYGIIEDPQRLDTYIAASQVGITLSSIALGIYGQQQLAPYLEPILRLLPFLSGDQAGSAAASAIIVLLAMTALQVVLGELVPKSLAIRYPESVAMATAVPMRISTDVILRPLIFLLNGSGTLLLRLFGLQRQEGHGRVHSPEEILILARESFRGGVIDPQIWRILRSAFRTRNTVVERVFVPRTHMATAEVSEPVRQVLSEVAESAYSRIPIYEGTIDQVIGYVHLRDLFALYRRDPGSGIRQILRSAPFVPETLPVLEVWERLDEAQSYVAIVIDEYGGTSGMVTREDLIEELFGEVLDEFDPDLSRIQVAGSQRVIVPGDMEVVEFNRLLNLALPEDRASTIAGLLLDELGRIPAQGEQVTFDNLVLRVERASSVAVETISVEPPTEQSAPPLGAEDG